MPVRATAIAVAAYAMLIFCFSPQLFLWRLISDPLIYPNPETHRAKWALLQLRNPFVRIDDPSTQVIRWRLLFPWLGYLLSLPDWAYLALPHLGCLAVLGYVASLAYRESGGTWSAFLAASAIGTTSWFFVSTEWLAYFDSWMILGILVVSFSTRRWAIAAACLFTPWVDERFVFTLPLALAVRVLYFDGSGRGRRRDLLIDGAVAVTIVAPYVLLRAWALAFAYDPKSVEHLRSHSQSPPTLGQYLDGLWSALRGVWALVAASVRSCLARGQVVRAVAVGLIALATILADARVARDLSRSFSNLIPLAVLGVVVLLRERPRQASWVLAIVLGVNLLAPARHVITGTFKPSPIRGLAYESARVRHPSDELARVYLHQGKTALEKRKLDEALRQFDAASRTNPASAEAPILRGLTLERMGRVREALASLDAAIRIKPGEPVSYCYRADLRRRTGDLPGAARDLRAALRLTPQDDANRRVIEKALEKLRASSDPGAIRDQGRHP